MKNIILIFLFVLLFNLTGCAGSPVAISLSSPAEIKKMSNNRLISYWRSKKAKKFAIEIKRRKLFTPNEWKHIKENNVAIGMRKKAVYASFGPVFKKIKHVTKNENVSAWKYRSATIIFGKNNKVIEMLQF